MRRWTIALIVLLVVVIGVGAFFGITLSSDLSAARSDIETLEDDKATLEGDIADLEAELASTEADLADSEVLVATLEADLATAQDDIESLESDLSTAQSQVSSLQSQKSSLQSQLNTLQGQYDSLESDVADCCLYGLILDEYFFTWETLDIGDTFVLGVMIALIDDDELQEAWDDFLANPNINLSGHYG